jgi:DNA-directed RNA polymerase beta subunit
VTLNWNIQNNLEIVSTYMLYIFYLKYKKECHIEDIDLVNQKLLILSEELYEDFANSTIKLMRTRKNFKYALTKNSEELWETRQDLEEDYQKWLELEYSLNIETI